MNEYRVPTIEEMTTIGFRYEQLRNHEKYDQDGNLLYSKSAWECHTVPDCVNDNQWKDDTLALINRRSLRVDLFNDEMASLEAIGQAPSKESVLEAIGLLESPKIPHPLAMKFWLKYHYLPFMDVIRPLVKYYGL